MITDIVLLFAEAIVIALWSVAYKETIFERWGEFTYVALVTTIGLYGVINNLWSLVILNFVSNPVLIIPVALGLLMLTRPLSRKLRTLALWPLALTLGYAMGALSGGLLVTSVYDQIISIFKISTATPTAANNYLMIQGILIFVIVFAGITYFTSTLGLEKNKATDYLGQVGRWLMIMGFGVAFGAYLIQFFGSMGATWQNLLYGWLGIPRPT